MEINAFQSVFIHIHIMKGKEIVQAFEGNDIVLSFNFSDLGMPIWPFIRFMFLDRYSAKINNLSLNKVGEADINISELFKSLGIATIRSPFQISNKEVLLFNSSVSNIKAEDGKYFNRISDYFFYQIPNRSALIEEPTGFKTVTPRVHDQVYSFLPLKLASILYARFKGFDKENTAQNIKQLIQYLRSVAPVPLDDMFWDECHSLFLSRISKVKAELSLYTWYLSRKKPKVMFLEDASYGSKLPLLLASKALKIPVVEPQHGLINENHLAYQFGEAVADKLTNFLPDYFLSYSDYWSSQINLPSRRVCIGNPHLDSYLLKFPKASSLKVLILGTGLSQEQLTAFCKLLYANKTFEGFRFVLRPHPWEQKFAAEKYAQLLEIGYELDTMDLYQSLSESSVVFGEMSTALFEASVYEIPVYLIETDHCKTNLTDSTPFPVVSIDTEVSITNYMTLSNATVPTLWAHNWKLNFQQFIGKFLN